MTVNDGLSPVPEGWYPDPANPARFRRWDGRNWTADVADARPAAPVSVPSAPVFAQPASPAQQTPAAAPATEPEVQTVRTPEPAPTPVETPIAAAEPQGMPTAPATPPTPPAAPPAPTTTAEPQSGPVSIPDWGTLPGLTLPPDLSAIPGLGNDVVLRMPKFEDGARLSPPQEPYGRTDNAQQQVPTSRRDLRGHRSDEHPSQPPAHAEPAAPYAPPPSGVQYTAPAPHGVAYTPPPPGTALPASALGVPPMSGRPADAGYVEPVMVTSRLNETTVGARYNARSASPSSSVKHAPTEGATGASVGVAETRRSSNTVGVWLIAILPLIQFAVVYVLYGVLAESVAPGIEWGILIAPAVLSLIFASIDRRKLNNDGHDRLPIVVLALIPPLYLLVRCFTVDWRSVVPLALWVVLQVASVVGVIVLLASVLKGVLAGA